MLSIYPSEKNMNASFSKNITFLRGFAEMMLDRNGISIAR